MNKLCKGMLAGTALLIAPVIQAAVIEWAYTVTTEWTSATFTNGGADANAIQNNSLISWGSASGDHTMLGQRAADSRSALEITDSTVTGNVFTNDLTPESTNTITHFNNTLSSSFDTLTDANLRTTLNLTPVNPVGPALPALMTDFTIDFIETNNFLACTFPSSSFCDDIFILQIGALNSSFNYEGVNYFVNIVELTGNLRLLPDRTCATAGVANGCFGFTTRENAITPANFGFIITAAIPEPATLGLFGLGLLGLSVFGRRRQIKK